MARFPIPTPGTQYTTATAAPSFLTHFRIAGNALSARRPATVYVWTHLQHRNSVMSLELAQIHKLAQLARIAVSDEQAAATADRLNLVLAMIDQLQAVDTSDVEPLAHPTESLQRLRADEVTETDRRAEFQAIAPAIADGLYLVPRVID